MAQDNATFELREPASPEPLLPGDPAAPLWIGLLVALVLLAIAAGLHASRADGSSCLYNRDDPYMPDLLICRREHADRVIAAMAAALPA